MAKRYMEFSAAALFFLLCNNLLTVAGFENECPNNGIKNTARLNQDFLMNARQQLPAFGNCVAYQLPLKVEFKCNRDQCIVSCRGKYSFPDGKTSLRMVCVGDQWIIRDSEYVSVPPCQGHVIGAGNGSYEVEQLPEHDKYLVIIANYKDRKSASYASEDSCDPVKRNKALQICTGLLTRAELQNCVKNLGESIHTCYDAYCNCPNQDDPATCSCDCIAMLVEECEAEGIQVAPGWRDLEICPISCCNGRVYSPCGPDTEPTCASAVAPPTGECNEGCFCPPGTVEHKEACISPTLCPCLMGEKEFEPGATIKQQCNTCTCTDGKWSCTDENCNGLCTVIGDPHYHTFDGKQYDFMGQCHYYLMRTSNLSVVSENVPASAGSLFTSPYSVILRFTVNSGIPMLVYLGRYLFTKINKKKVYKYPIILGNGEVIIRQGSPYFILVDFSDGAQIAWDGETRLSIKIPYSYSGKTEGLCGTFNFNTQDDFQTPEGDVETDVYSFANKWRTSMTNCFSYGRFSKDVAPAHPCTLKPEKRAVGKKYCEMIQGKLFQDCHWAVKPEQYYEDCLFDVCACKGEPSKCFCPILSAYGNECMRQGIKTDWRLGVKACAIKCPAGQIFDECGDSCQRTCSDLVSKYTCKKECIEGCRCPHGEYLNDNNECVPRKHCPCTYEGLTFKSGYKEVRPSKKSLSLCTCVGAAWECENAGPDDKDKYPPTSELRAECVRKPYAEFSNCVPKEPKTCKNMNSYKEDLKDCTLGCSCMNGYVYDTSRKVCVLPGKCSCHHGSKIYNAGEHMKDGCNECICQSGNWKCSSNGCASTCSVWGYSHFTTFDNHDFDFQGACNYTLSKGVADNGDAFTITIQNVLCGTMGVTCSKSAEIAISTSGVKDSITLTTDSTYLEDPNKSAINRLRDAVNSKAHGSFHIYKAGVFIVIEVIPLKLQVKWDEGTRVYVKLGKEWKHKVNGLCGNYNDNSKDDMQTPSQGLVTSPLIFGHAWKVQQSCAKPTKPIDACRKHPGRKTWAQLKCGVLKSSLFEECHAEVPVEKYLKRCIFDTCACDQGGDCECLCSAIAAYAHSCSQRGITIRWRTPHFCPMQCDPHSAEYESCTPACAIETCDNFQYQGLSDSMCNKENCLEGCKIKLCDEGMIYLNDTYIECVPKSKCKALRNTTKAI